MKNILFVCRHNVNRSRAAEVIARKMLTEKNLEAEVNSAGISVNYSDGNPHHLISRELSARGYPQIVKNSRKSLNVEMLSQADLVLTMSPEQYDEIKERFNLDKSKLFTLPQYARYENEDYDASIDEPSRYILDTRHPHSNVSEYQGMARIAGKMPVCLSNTFLWCAGGKVDCRSTHKIRKMYSNTVDDIEMYVAKSIKRMEREGFFR